MKAFVIMCNDYPQGVCLGDEEAANIETEKLKARYFEQSCRHTMTAEEYGQRCFWTPREVDIMGPTPIIEPVDTDEPVTRIQGWKRNDDGKTSSPTADHATADHFEVSYLGMLFSTSAMRFETHHDAETFARACARVFDAGRRRYARELRRFLGVKD